MRRIFLPLLIALIANVVWAAIPPLKLRVVEGWSRAWSVAQMMWSASCLLIALALSGASMVVWGSFSPDDPDEVAGPREWMIGLGFLALMTVTYFAVYLAIIGG